MINQNLLLTGDDGYNLTNSLRFRSSASAYLNRTYGTPTDAKKWTLSFWLKRGLIGSSSYQIMSAGSAVSDQFHISSDSLSLYLGGAYRLVTTQVLRDPAAWYHIVLVIDTANATADNRNILYINGVQVTSFSTRSNLGPNATTNLNAASTVTYIGRYAASSSEYIDGYLAEVNFIDGQALTPSSFGETSTSTGVWIPKKFSGTYGTNGFYLDFEDTSSTAALGYDAAGSNDWTVNNISLTAGSTYDSMTDVPTLTSATVANYATFNPLNSANNGTLGGGNLNIDSNSGSASAQTTAGTMSMKSGKYYFEYTRVQSSNDTRFGIIRDDKFISGGNVGLSASEYGYYVISSGTLSVDGTTTSSWITAFSQGDVGMIAYDANTGKVWFGRNGTWGGSGDPAAGTNPAATVNSFATYGYTAWVRVIGGGSPAIEQGAINFGQRPFAYTPPTGFVRLNTFNLTTPTIGAIAAELANEYFDATLYTGNGSTRTITNSGSMQPDFVWIKNRTSGSFWHQLYDVNRGPLKALFSNQPDAESTYTDTLTAFTSTGFTLGTDATFNGGVNKSSDAYVAWQWKASGTTSNITVGQYSVSPNVPSIASTVSANTTAGFSIVTYTGNATNGATVGHGLGVSPSMIIGKIRSTTGDWYVWQTAMGDNFMKLNTTAAQLASTANGVYNTASFSSTVFALGSGSSMNASGGTYVAYCWAPIAGYSAFGSYTGNGSADGPFVFTGFKPAFILVKRTDSTGNWCLFDNKRLGYNGTSASKELYPNLSLSEGTSNGPDQLSNGFKFRDTYSDVNGSGATYIYMAFAENPFKYANAR